MMKRLTLIFLTSASMLTVQDLGLPEQAQAVVGRPLTPMSYAGVARRTTRRAVYGTAAVGAAAVGTAAVVGSAAVISTLPSGCVNSIYGGLTYHHCGSVYYQPMYDGPNVTYQQLPGPPQAQAQAPAQPQAQQ